MQSMTVESLYVTQQTTMRETPPPPSDIDSDYAYFMDNLSAVDTAWVDDPVFLPTTLTYSVTFVVGLCGNGLALAALLADVRSSRNATCLFLANLAIADLIFLMLSVPYEVFARFVSHWTSGEILCKLAAYVETVAGQSTVLNLAAVSIERYIVIVHPFLSRTWCTPGKSKKVIACLWLVALFISAPIIDIMDTRVGVYYNNTTYVTKVTCSDSNPRYGQRGRLVIAYYRLFVSFLLPTLIIGYCYAIVIRALRASAKDLSGMTEKKTVTAEGSMAPRMPSHTSASGGRHQRLIVCTSSNFQTGRTCDVGVMDGDEVAKSLVSRRSRSSTHTQHHSNVEASVIRARKQVMKMLLIIIAVFLVCWGPKLILAILKRHELDFLASDAAFYVGLMINLLPYVQSCLNPLIYGFMSKNFRKNLRRVFNSCCRPSPRHKRFSSVSTVEVVRMRSVNGRTTNGKPDITQSCAMTAEHNVPVL